MKAEDAEEYTQALGQVVAGGWRQIALGERLGVPKALGFTTEQWVKQRLGGYVQMSVAERRQAVKELSAEGMSTRQIEGVVGKDHATVARDVNVANATTEFNSRVDEALASVANATEALDTLTGLAADEKMRKRAERIQRDEAAKAKREAPRPETNALPPSVDIRFGDFEVVLANLERGSVDLVLTDPPYPADYLRLWGRMAEMTAAWLKPGGLLVALSGQHNLRQAMQRLAVHLEYWWCGALLTSGPGYVSHAREVQSQSKPVLFYVRKGDRPSRRLVDTFVSDGEQKTEHLWQQNLACYEQMVERLSDPNALIVDPFVGGGTTALACHRLDRRFIGAEIDEESHRKALERLV